MPFCRVLPIGAGMLLYLAFWYKFMRDAGISFLSKPEHEITHCVFAWLTFNRVVALKATLRLLDHQQGFDLCLHVQHDLCRD